jgi:hypothetical protein
MSNGLKQFTIECNIDMIYNASYVGSQHSIDRFRLLV